MTNEELNLFELDFEYELLGDDIDAFKAIVDDYTSAEPTEENNDALRHFFFDRVTSSDEAVDMITYAANTLEFILTDVPLAILTISNKRYFSLKEFKKTEVYRLMNDESIEFYNETEKGFFISTVTSMALQFRDRTFIKEVRTAVARIKDIEPSKE